MATVLVAWCPQELDEGSTCRLVLDLRASVQWVVATLGSAVFGDGSWDLFFGGKGRRMGGHSYYPQQKPPRRDSSPDFCPEIHFLAFNEGREDLSLCN